MDNRSKIRNLIREILTEKDVKIYLQKGQTPPKGKKIQKGPKGGQYFMGSPEEKETSNGPKRAIKKNFKPEKPDSKPDKKPGAGFKGKKVDGEPDGWYTNIKNWIKKNSHKQNLNRVDFNKVKANYPGLTDDQQQEYARFLLYPFHNSFTNYDMKSHFKKLSDSQLKKNPRESMQLESNNVKQVSAKLSSIFNSDGFRYYGPGDGRSSSIVAPSTSKKWYSIIKDKLEKNDIDVDLYPAQRAGYYVVVYK